MSIIIINTGFLLTVSLLCAVKLHAEASKQWINMAEGDLRNQRPKGLLCLHCAGKPEVQKKKNPRDPISVAACFWFFLCSFLRSALRYRRQCLGKGNPNLMIQKWSILEQLREAGRILMLLSSHYWECSVQSSTLRSDPQTLAPPLKTKQMWSNLRARKAALQ